MAAKKTKLEDKIDQFLHQCSKNEDNKQLTLDLGKVTKAEAKAAKKVGFEIFGFKKTITSSAVNHIKKNHGDEQKEKSRGQLAMTEERIKDSIINSRNPYKAVNPQKGHNTEIRYELKSGSREGEHTQLNEVNVKKKEVGTVTFWLKKMVNLNRNSKDRV